MVEDENPTVAVAGEAETVREVRDVLSDEDLGVETVEPDDLLSSDAGPDCVITDDGAVLRRIGESDTDLPAVVVSDGSADVQDAVEFGAMEYVELPLGDADRTMLRRRVRRYAEATHRRAKHAERKQGLREAKRMYKAFVDDPNILVGVLDTDGTLIYPNPKSLEYVEAEPSQVVGKPFWDTPWCDSSTKDEMADSVRRAAEGEVVEYNAEHLEEGTENYITSGFVRPVTDESGDVRSVIVSSRDITKRIETEGELETNLELLRQTEVLSDTGGWELDVGTGEQRWTHGTRRIHGVGEGYEPTAEGGIGFYHPDDRDEIREAVRNCRENGEPYDKELRLITADDELRWVRTRGEAVRENGEVVRLRGAIQDITEHKRYERELERYESLWNKLPIGVCRIRADNGGDFLRVNDHLVEMTGAGSEDELLSLSTDDFWTDEKDREEMLELIKQNGWVIEEHRFQALDGDYVWARVTAIGHETEEGMFLDAVVQDITDRRQREEQLEKAEEIADMGSWYMDLSADDIYWSDRVYELWDLDCDGPMGYSTYLEDHVHPDDEEYVDKKWQEAKEGEPYDIEYRILDGDGEVRWMRDAAQVTFEDDEPVSATGIVQDITERKEREGALEHRKEQVEFFNGLLRHELLNSMTVIRGGARTVLDGTSEDDEVYEDIKRVYDRSGEVVELIDRVRSVLKSISGGDRRLRHRNLVETVKQRAASLAESHDAEVTVEAPEEAYVEADEFLDDVIDNLLTNAVEHNDKEEPRVDITVERGEETTVLRVADNGPGIPDRMKEAVFGQGEKGRSSGGVGFGLYFVESMVSEYGGDVRVEDNEPEGAVFVIELPNEHDGKQGVRE
jgi:PAS domain S-box-containing protein